MVQNYDAEVREVTVPVLGRCNFKLGSLYDIRSETVSNFSLWRTDTIQKGKQEKKVPYSSCDIKESNSFKNKTDMLKISGKLSIGLFSNLINISGSGNFLKESKEKSESVSVTLHYEKVTRQEWIPNEMFASIGNIDFKDNLEREDCTHVVVCITYGGKAFFSFEKEFSSEDSDMDAGAALKAKIEKIPSTIIELEGKGQFKNTDNSSSNEMSCKYYGDIDLDEIPGSYEEVVQTYKGLPKLITDDKAVPIQVTLMPLKNMGSKSDRIIKDIDNHIIERCSEKIEELANLKMDVHKMMKSKACKDFPTLFETCSKFEKLLKEYETSFQIKLKGLIPRCCFGEEGADAELKELFESTRKTPFFYNHLRAWITNKQEELAILEQLVDRLIGDKTKIQVCKSMALAKKAEKRLSVDFTVKLDPSDQFIEEMSLYLESKRITNKTYKIQSILLDNYIFGSELATRYFEFALGNTKNEEISFLVREMYERDVKNTTNAFNVIVIENGSSSEWNNIISAPRNLDLKRITHCSCEISWNAPEFSRKLIRNYILTILKEQKTEINEESTELLDNVIIDKIIGSDVVEIKLHDLSLFSRYRVELKAATGRGYSPSAFLDFTTLPSEPVKDIVATAIGSERLEIEWKPPTVLHSEASLTGYDVSVDEFTGDGDFETIDIDEPETTNTSFKMENLKPITEYKFRINVKTDKGNSNKCQQLFRTTSKDGFPGNILHKLWKILKSKDFEKAERADEMIDQIQELISLKRDAEKQMEDRIEIFVHQILIAYEFQLFISKWLETFLGVEYHTEMNGRGKLKDFVFPFDENNFPKNRGKIASLFDWIFQNNSEKITNLQFQSIDDLKLLFNSFRGDITEPSYVHQFKMKLTIFMNHAQNTFEELESCILFMMLKKYKISGKEKAFTTSQIIDLNELLNDLCDFQENIINKKNECVEKYGYEANCIRYAMKHSSDKKHEFELLQSIVSSHKQSNSSTDTSKYMKEFIKKWDESRLYDFLKILETNQDFADMFYSSNLNKDLVHKLSKLSSNLPKNPVGNEENALKTLSGEKIKEPYLKLFQETLKKLDFEKYMQDDIKREDMYSIEKKQKDSGDLKAPLIFLQKLFSLDSRCRVQKKTFKKTKEEVDNEESLLGLLNQQDTTSSKQGNSNEISSADVILTAVVACDPFLLQDVFEKLAACQLAIPVMFENPKSMCVVYHLYGLKSIKKKWIQQTRMKSMEANIASRKAKTVSFCRFGKIKTSKSKVANLFLSTAQGWPEHSYFLNKDNDVKSCLNSGSIEVCWYCPEGRDEETLNDLTCIYNLRGDARENKNQFEFLLKVSSLVVIFLGDDPITQKELETLQSCQPHIILVQTNNNGNEKKYKKINILFSKNKTVTNVAKDICNNIDFYNDDIPNDVLKSIEEHASAARELGIAVDEDNDACKKGKRFADEFIKMINKHKIENLKRSVVPLQDEQWKIWAWTDKEEFRHKFRSEREDGQKYSSDLRDAKRLCREKQRNIGPSDEMIRFLEYIINLSGHSYKYFMQYIQLYLNKKSQLVLPQFLEKYNHCTSLLNDHRKELEKFHRSESMVAKTEIEIKNRIDNSIKQVKEVAEQFDRASFGIEHILRELAQIYESLCDCSSNIPSVVETLPKLMVELMLNGYPLEIMDGNVSHIPITWLEKVFLELKKELKNARIYVLSIIGIQSSGKSTFLNTMHGSKFSVSSGRCTKGVFVQLLPVKEEWREKLNCDYYMLMDSEGLRSPELGESFHHDNEIATLITCLANITIINFWGQTFSKDMADIILIAAYAYIRMKEVKIKSSFHMIFASVHDVTAAEKNQFGVSKVMEEINKMVLEVAQSEGRTDLFQGFKSIFPMLQESHEDIKFPQFLPVLWHGTMSPPESRYGELANELKNSMIEILSLADGYKHVQPIDEFLNRLKDVWRAIKEENFIFAFRNSQAVQVYNQLQAFLEEKLKNLREVFYIEAWEVERDAVEVSLNTSENDVEKAISTYEESVDNNLVPKIEDEATKIIKSLRDHISKLSNSDHGMMHLETLEMHLKKNKDKLLEDEKSRVKKKIKVIFKKEMTAADKQTKFKKRFLIRAREIAIEVRSKEGKNATISVDVMNRKFEGLFNTFLQEAKVEDSDTFGNPLKIFNEMFSSCQSYLVEKTDLLNLGNRKVLNTELTIAKQNRDDLRYQMLQIRYDKYSFHRTGTFKSRDENAVRNELLQKLIEVKAGVHNITSQASTKSFNYNNTVNKVLQFVYDKTNIDKGEHGWFFDKIFLMHLFIDVFVFVIGKMEERQLEIMRSSSLVTFLENEKLKFKKEFEADCTAANIEIRSAETFAKNVLLGSVMLRIQRTMGNEIFNNLTSTEIFSNKNILMYRIQKDLLDKSLCKNLSDFCKDFNKYVRDWINSHVNDFCNKKDYLKNMFESKIKIEKEDIIKCLQEVTDKAKSEGMVTSTWYSALEKKLKQKPMVQDIKDEREAICKIQDVQFTTGEMIRVINDTKLYEQIIEESLKKSLVTMEKVDDEDKNNSLLNWFDFDPLENLCKERIGCDAQCVFCGAKCSSGIPCVSQKHIADFHRPIGLIGRHWGETKKLSPNICTYLVGSDIEFKLSSEKKKKYNIEHDNFIPYENVKDVITDWDIKHIRDAMSQEFWQYLFAKHHVALAEDYGLKPADIPNGWERVTRDEALKCLKHEHKILE